MTTETRTNFAQKLARELAEGLVVALKDSSGRVLPALTEAVIQVRFEELVAPILAPYFAARDEREEEVRELISDVVEETEALLKDRCFPTISRTGLQGLRDALALLQKDAGGEM